MKVAVECKSPLMQKSLEMFLQKHLCSLKQCDIVIRDSKCLNDDRCFYISSDEDADLTKPFSKSQLILALEKRYKSMNKEISHIQEQKEDIYREYASLDFSILEKRIDSLTKEYKQNILQAVRAFYEE
jgi:predicted patatin/cPLA2 family phospholipase